MTRLRALWGWLRGGGGADRVVPRGAQSALSVGFLAAVMGFFAVLALALALAAGRLAATWEGEIADTATLQVFAAEDAIPGAGGPAFDPNGYSSQKLASLRGEPP